MTRDAHNSLEAQLQLIKQDSVEDLNEAINLLENLSNHLSLIPLDDDTVFEEINTIFEITTIFDQITVFDSDRNLLLQIPDRTDLVLETEIDQQQFDRALKSEQTILSNIQINPDYQKQYISIYTPIYFKSQISGIIKGTFDIEKNFFNPTILSADLGKTGHAFLVDDFGNIIAHGREEWIGANVSEIVVDNIIQEGYNVLNEKDIYITEYKTLTGSKRVLVSTYLVNEMLVGISYDQEELYASQQQLQNVFIWITALTMIIVLVLGLWTTRKISLPITLMTEQANKIAKGNLKAPFPKEKDYETKKIIQALKKVLKENDNLLIQTIKMISTALEKSDEYTAGHSERVTEYALNIAKFMDLSEEEKEDLKLGATLHDIGKVGVPDHILNKAGGLTDEEFTKIKQHPVYGDEIIANITSLQHIRPIVRSHHERWDGKGYPDKLKGEEIDKLARITCVADTFDAMTSDRPYRKGMPKEKANQIIKSESGKQFDASVVEAFTKWQNNEG